jgi:hypothetical protein
MLNRAMARKTRAEAESASVQNLYKNTELDF